MRALLLAVFVTACHSHVDGNITLDGAPFVVTTCRSGAAFNFSGIQLADDHGTQLRVMQKVDGSIAVAVFASAGAAKGDTIGADCGTIKLQSQSSRINNVQNVEGNVNLSCEGAGHKVSGSANFENCH